MIPSSSSRPRLTLIGACLAVAILGVVVTPWPTPSPEVVIAKFVPELITVDPRGFLPQPGQVHITARETVLSTIPHSQPTVHVLTAELPFTAMFSVAILKQDAADSFPFQVKVWNPRSEVAVEAWYAPDGTVMAGVRAHERWWQTRSLGRYTVGSMQTWRIVRSGRRLSFEVWGEGVQATFEVNQESLPRLFDQETLSLTMYASSPGGGSSIAAVRGLVIGVPRQTRYGTMVHSPLFRPIVSLVALLSLLWLAASRSILGGRPKLATRDLIIVLLLVGASVLAGWGLSKIPGHPLDVRAVFLWSTIAREHGSAAITGHSLVATEGHAHGGQPYAAMSFPYPPLLTYLFWVVGKVAPAGRAEQTSKMLTMVGVVAGGAVLFALLRRLRLTPATAALATGAYVLNPAILFDSAVWGQTDAFVALFLLIAAAGVVLGSAPLLLTGTLLAFLTKQTGGLFAPLLLALGLTRLGARQMAQGLPAAIVIVFLMLTPAFLAGTHPSSTYRPVVAKVLAFGTVREMEPVNAIITQGSFTLWSAVAGLEGARGWARMAFPDYVPSQFGVSYFTLSRVAFALFVLLPCLLFLRRRGTSPGVVFLTIAAYAVGVAVLFTRVQSRYLYFGVMFTAASLPWMSRGLGTVTLTVLTGTMLAAMWGLLVFMSVWYPGLLPVFEPWRSWLNTAAAAALGSDVGITVGGLLNMGALMALLTAAWWAHGHHRAPRSTVPHDGRT